MGSMHSLGDVARQLLMELSDLYGQQSEALRKASYGHISQSEKEAFDQEMLTHRQGR